MMLDSSPEKPWYYEKYYQKKHQLPHAIVVDENKQLRDGYIYLIFWLKSIMSVQMSVK